MCKLSIVTKRTLLPFITQTVTSNGHYLVMCKLFIVTKRTLSPFITETFISNGYYLVTCANYLLSLKGHYHHL